MDSAYSHEEVQEFVARLARGEAFRTLSDRRMLQELQMRMCSRCRLVKPFSCFHRRCSNQAPSQRMHVVCAPCSSQKKLEYRRACAEAAKALIPALKLTKKECASGGMSYSQLLEIRRGLEQTLESSTDREDRLKT